MENVHRLPHDRADHDGPDPGDGPTDDLLTDAERYVLGGCMADPRHVPTVRSLITGTDFSRPAHELIWNAITHLADNGQPTDHVSVRIELEQRKQLTRAGGLPALLHLSQYTAGSPDYFAEQVRAASDLRAEAALGRQIVQRATAPDAVPGGAVTFIDDYLKRQQERAAGRSGDPADALLAELLDASSLDNMPALEPLVGDLLHLDSLARIIGPSGHMKSFVTIDIAGHVGTGMPWHGHHVKQGTVVYLVAEGARGIRKRVRAWEKHYGLKMDNVLFFPRPVQTRGAEWDVWIEAMRRLEPALIVIDTQARVSVGVEENSNTELGLVIERIEDLRRATAACVLVVHHTGHVGEHGRGASAAKGALQSELHVSKKGDHARNMIVTVKVGKQKDDEEGADLQFGLKVITLDGEAKPDGSPVTSVVLKSMDRVDPATVQGSPEWIVKVLSKGGIPASWGYPRVSKWLAGEGIQVRKDKIEEALRIRKANGTGGDIPDAQTWTHPELSQDRGREGAQNAPENYPPSPAQTPPHKTPRDLGGSSGEPQQNPSSNIPPTPGGGAGSPPHPTSPTSPVPKDGEVRGEALADHAVNEPFCTICGRVMNADWANRGYETHIGCDPRTGSHPTTAA